MNRKVLVISHLKDETKNLFQQLKEYDFTFSENPDDKQLAEAEIIVGDPSHEMLAKCPHLVWLQTDSAGINQYQDLDPSITISNAPAYGHAIAEYLTAWTCTIDRNLDDYMQNQKERSWKLVPFGKGIENMKILSVGMGAIGKEYLKCMHSMGAECYGITHSLHETPEFCKKTDITENLDKYLPKMDVVALSLPETKETIHLFNKEKLSLMKKGSILMSVGRGSAIEETALLKLARENHFRAVVLDVTEHEPLPENSPLWTCRHVYITPHIAGRFQNPLCYDRVVAVIIENLKRAAADQPLLHTLNRTKGY